MQIFKNFLSLVVSSNYLIIFALINRERILYPTEHLVHRREGERSFAHSLPNNPHKCPLSRQRLRNWRDLFVAMIAKLPSPRRERFLSLNQGSLADEGDPYVTWFYEADRSRSARFEEIQREKQYFHLELEMEMKNTRVGLALCRQ